MKDYIEFMTGKLSLSFARTKSHHLRVMKWNKDVTWSGNTGYSPLLSQLQGISFKVCMVATEQTDRTDVSFSQAPCPTCIFKELLCFLLLLLLHVNCRKRRWLTGSARVANKGNQAQGILARGKINLKSESSQIISLCFIALTYNY